MIASLTARANAVRMLHTRISLLKTYLNSLSPSYLTSTATSTDSSGPPQQQQPQRGKEEEEEQEPNHPLLRSISALLSRLPLLSPPTPAALASFTSETLAEKSDVELVSLLGTLGQSVKDARELGRKFGIVENARSAARKNVSAAGGGGGGGGGGGVGTFGGPGGIDLTGGGDGMQISGGDLWGGRGGGSPWGNGAAG